MLFFWSALVSCSHTYKLNIDIRVDKNLTFNPEQQLLFYLFKTTPTAKELEGVYPQKRIARQDGVFQYTVQESLCCDKKQHIWTYAVLDGNGNGLRDSGELRTDLDPNGVFVSEDTSMRLNLSKMNP